MATERARVAIVGCGPVGLVLANLLGTHGVPTLVLERDPGTAEEPRAIGIAAESLRELRALGLYDEIALDLELGISVEYVNGRGRRLYELASGESDVGGPRLSSFDRPVFERQLLAGLDRFEYVEVRFEHTVESVSQNSDAVHIKGIDANGTVFEVEAEYLVGCDGSDSTVREAIGIPSTSKAAPQRCLVIDVLDVALMDDLPGRFFCNPARPGMTLHEKGPRRRWEFLLLPGETEEQLLEDRTIRRLLAPHTRADHVEIERKCIETLEPIVAQSFREGRVLIAGDAAHTMPVFCGRGLDSGLSDAWNLFWKLGLVLDGQASETLLDSYQVERRPHVIREIEWGMRLAELIHPVPRIRAFIRDICFFAINATRSGRRAFADSMLRRMNEPAHEQGVFVAPGQSLVGKKLIQPQVRDQEMKLVPLDEKLGPGFALLCYGIDPKLALEDDGARTFWAQLGAKTLHIVPRGIAPTGESVEDVSGALGEAIERRFPILAIRPDRLVAAVFEPGNALEVAQAFRNLLKYPR
ncbi:MAG: hypothetical protein GY725_14410 [bacterium]|nr:hypothetical protein [bacterium]